MGNGDSTWTMGENDQKKRQEVSRMKAITTLTSGFVTFVAGAASAHPGHGAVEGLLVHGLGGVGMIGVVLTGLFGLLAIWLGVRGKVRFQNAGR